MMRKLSYIFSILVAITLVVASCDDSEKTLAYYGVNEGDWYQNPASTPDCYIINSGNWNGNDASIQYCDFDARMVSSPLYDKDIFARQNNAILGDLAQDMLWIDGKLFVSVSTSQKIEVLDEKGKRLREPHKFTAEGACPRMMATDGRNIYVTNYDGNVYVYDAATAESIDTIPVGVRPEGISCCNGHLVVNNSGDLYAYNGTVTIIDMASGERQDIPMTNPYTASIVCNGAVYIIDSGNYSDIPSNIYRIQPDNATVEPLNIGASSIAAYENILYYVNSTWSYDVGASGGFVTTPLYALDVVTNEKQEIIPAADMENINSLSVNPENGDIFVGRNATEVGVLGTMYVYTLGGELKSLFDVGYYTAGARFESK